ncbi:SET domain-containing protein [Patescibacteria group bacterium]|nr:SET domain-containing protein [Patescibacteria group bacterium]
MENKTTEFSFVLKKSKYGVGVFAVHGIKAKTFLKLFGDQVPGKKVAKKRKKEDLPKIFQEYCIDRGDIMLCPKDFGRMEVGWHLNHSKKPNAAHKNYKYYALRDIKEGEEITIDYNSLEEPEENKETYYKHT